MSFISIQEIESAINYWRDKSPSAGESLELCAEASCLAKPYALMIIQASPKISLAGLNEKEQLAWSIYLNHRDLNDDK